MRKLLGKLGGGNLKAIPPRRHAVLALFSHSLPRRRSGGGLLRKSHLRHPQHLDSGTTY